MKIFILVLGILFMFMFWPFGLFLIIIGAIIPSAREEEHTNEIVKLKERITELEKMNVSMKNTQVKPKQSEKDKLKENTDLHKRDNCSLENDETSNKKGNIYSI